MSGASKDFSPERKIMTGGPGPSSTNAACAACKYQRRKCAPDCPLAPYFPPDQPKRFHNVHKLFGVSSILRILRQVDPDKREDTVKSIVYEADTREKDPVHGCLGVISLLQNQVTKLKGELNLARDQLYLMEQQQHASSIIHQAYGHQHGGGQANYLHHQLQQQYGTSHQAGGYHDATGQAMSFHDNKSSHSPYHDHARYVIDSGALHDMLGQPLKVEAGNPYSRVGMRYGADTGASLQDEQAGSNALADLQRRSFYHQPSDAHVGRHVDPLIRSWQGLDSLTNQSSQISDHELRNAGVHLSLTNQYSS